ncbi:hypothetical protein SmJEL517_g00197 [Synchytrium microbalum]|uniref:Enoyl reductase (ER) domain-containing protein n=1 Tax=Synchytrium microbalum TaxID=1806994 RepID=A0A507CBD3_9FUNG|nr:uncharacterized protein SmJEL517_g00197 [Synchytrium microbalum]TPX38377.1 hypothetical protein SmJEL517_g00197 [Synchytrium microbalum]
MVQQTEMLAARVHDDRKLHLDTVPVPTVRPGALVIKVLAVHTWSYTGEVISGERNFSMPQLPTILGTGGIGEIAQIGEGVFDLEVGDWVLMDPQVGNVTRDTQYDNILVGWTSTSGPIGERIQKLWKEGSFAEYCLFPATHVAKLGPQASKLYSAPTWSSIRFVLLAYAALMRGDFKAGCTVLINGATGTIGSGAVVLAMALGAGKVICVGRKQSALEALKELAKKFPLPERLVTVSSVGEQDEVIKRLQEACGKTDANRGADLVLDVVGNATPESTTACLSVLRKGGIMVLDGSLSAPLSINYGNLMRNNLEIRGQYMFTPQQMQDLIKLINVGIVDLSLFVSDAYPLKRIHEGIEAAAAMSGEFPHHTLTSAIDMLSLDMEKDFYNQVIGKLDLLEKHVLEHLRNSTADIQTIENESTSELEVLYAEPYGDDEVHYDNGDEEVDIGGWKRDEMQKWSIKLMIVLSLSRLVWAFKSKKSQHTSFLKRLIKRVKPLGYSRAGVDEYFTSKRCPRRGRASKTNAGLPSLAVADEDPVAMAYIRAELVDMDYDVAGRAAAEGCRR